MLTRIVLYHNKPSISYKLPYPTVSPNINTAALDILAPFQIVFGDFADLAPSNLQIAAHKLAGNL